MTDTQTAAPARYCAYAQAGIMTEDGSAHVVAYVERDEPGYAPTTYTGTLDYCEAVARSINERAGVSDAERDAIVTSSFQAQAARR